MEFDSIKHLGVNPDLFDIDKCYEIYDQGIFNHIIVLYLKKETNVQCPICDSFNISSRGTRAREFIHANTKEQDVRIKLYSHVYKCNECNSYFQQRNPFILQGRKTTHQNDVMILEDLKDINATFTSIANKYGVSVTFVQNLFDKKVDIPRGKLPEVLAIDEVYVRKVSKYKYCCVLYDPIHHKIIDVLDCRHKNYLIDYFAKIPMEEKEKVFAVSMDLYRNYRDISRICLPYSIVCADSFHVIKNLQECFNKLRIRIMKQYEFLKKENSMYYWYFKKFWKLLVMNIKDPSQTIEIRKTHQTLTISSIIDTMLKVSDELKTAYYLKEAYREFNLTATFADAEEQFDDLCERFKNCRIKEFYRFRSLLLEWKPEILNSFFRINGYRISNGNLERKNSDIKTIIKVSNGYRNFPRLRNRIMFSINKNESIQANRKSKTNKLIGKKRKPYNKEK